MTDTLPRVLLALGVATFGAFGLAFTLFPTALAAFVGIEAVTPSARADIAATYGGLEVGLAAFQAWCLRRGAVRTGLVAAACGFGGLGAVRLGHLVVGGGSPFVWALLGAEVVGVGLALWGARRAGDAASSRP